MNMYKKYGKRSRDNKNRKRVKKEWNKGMLE